MNWRQNRRACVLMTYILPDRERRARTDGVSRRAKAARIAGGRVELYKTLDKQVLRVAGRLGEKRIHTLRLVPTYRQFLFVAVEKFIL